MEAAGGCYNSGIVGSGAGGSSFISGYTGANAIEETSTSENIVHTGNSMHYSGLSFVDSQMLDGNTSMPSQDGTTTITGNTGNGSAKISYISSASLDSSLKSLKVDKGTMVEEFSPDVHEYTVKLNGNEYIVNFELETNDPLASVEESEYINILVPVGKSKHKINVYAQDGTSTQYIINFERTANSCSYINGITISDKYYKFTEGVYNYELALPYDTPDIAKIEYFKANELQKISSESQYINVSEDNKILRFKVIAEDGTTKEYRLTLNREHNVYLKNIELTGFNLNPKFNAETTEYTIQVLNSMTNVNIYAVAYDKNSVITITGQDNISVGSTITITVTNPYISDTKVYTITCEQASTETQYSYSGEYKEFIAPYTGLYKFECWGGIGGKARLNGSLGSLYGKGGYAKGEITLTKGEKLYVYVGENGHDSVVGQDSLATWNGGGLGTWDRSDNETSGSGGGATDIRLISGDWNDSKSLASRIMVAGGAGGTSWSYTPGNGGGISGTTSYSGSPAGTQTSGYLFGIGRDGWGVADNDGVAGGGGGYYGGQTNNVGGHSSGAGGSGYISGHEGCIAINSAENITPKVDTYSEISDSYHYSGKIFTNTELTTGASTTSKATITLLNIIDTNPPIENITVNKGKMTRNFNQSETDYYIELDEDEVYPTITVTTTSDDVTVEGGTEQTIETPIGETIKQIKATTKEGVEYIYNLHFIRKASSNSYLKNIKIGGKEIENFVATKTRYEITIPYYTDDTLEIDAIKEFPSQIVTGIGTIDVSNPSTIHTISVTSEDGNSTTEYTLILNREPTTKLKSIDIQNEDFASIFQSDKYEYEIEVTTGVISLNIQTIPYIKDCKVTIKGAGYIKEGKNLITITSSKEGLESSVYKIYVTKGESLGEIKYDFDYTGDYQVFTAPALGYYKFEAWGASGGLSRLQGGLGGTPGKGGYTSGIIKLNEGDQFYVYVGGQGTNAIVGQNVPGGWNGGGLGTWDNSDNEAAGGGGGATDFRLVSGDWNDSASLYSRIMVAGAGRRSILVLQRRLWRRIKWIFTLFMLSSWNSNFRLCSGHG